MIHRAVALDAEQEVLPCIGIPHRHVDVVAGNPELRFDLVTGVPELASDGLLKWTARRFSGQAGPGWQLLGFSEPQKSLERLHAWPALRPRLNSVEHMELNTTMRSLARLNRTLSLR